MSQRNEASENKRLEMRMVMVLRRSPAGPPTRGNGRTNEDEHDVDPSPEVFQGRCSVAEAEWLKYDRVWRNTNLWNFDLRRNVKA